MEAPKVHSKLRSARLNRQPSRSSEHESSTIAAAMVDDNNSEAPTTTAVTAVTAPTEAAVTPTSAENENEVVVAKTTTTAAAAAAALHENGLPLQPNEPTQNTDGDNVVHADHKIDTIAEMLTHRGDGDRIQKGILGYMDKQMKAHKKAQAFGDLSPAHSRSRSGGGGGGGGSTDKMSSPRRKRSKSGKRRERKMIAAGELEVIQANETLMRYLRQCSEINDASLSGELEIDQNIDERRVNRKTKSQRERRSHLMNRINGKLPPSNLTTVLNSLRDDIVPNHDDIYNPFTPVISPTEGPPARIEKMFIQTAQGYRAVDFYKPSARDIHTENRSIARNGVQLSCKIQRVWIRLSNICHGILGGLAIAHLLFVLTMKPYDLADSAFVSYGTFTELYADLIFFLCIVCIVSVLDRMDLFRPDLSGESISFKWIIIVMIYLASIILSFSVEPMEDQFAMSNGNMTETEKGMITKKVLNIWNSLSIARSVLCTIGCIFVGLSPNEDQLYEHLAEMEKYQVN